ncbi:uncharacterized protein LOC126966834 [Leptidea sinapis]|uniref:uncharacterized protein LOC126966834 n=1 Tax=Leptidea sinapis TaxID=189913 RepID=UPI00212733CB|nr:uncharacterized protein LOC126966834 [Leptidea sinapis]XP_050667050.1 uncharacterized protein LOC126966834 [Leptidea sinapis]
MNKEFLQVVLASSSVQAVDKSDSNVWIICKSTKYPHLPYYFNTSTGEAVWNLCEAEITKARKTALINQQKIHNFPEPTESPNDLSLHQIIRSRKFGQRNVYNKQIINNHFSGVAFTSSDSVGTHDNLTPILQYPSLNNVPSCSDTSQMSDLHDIPQTVNSNTCIPLSERFQKFYHTDSTKTDITQNSKATPSKQMFQRNVEGHKIFPHNFDLRYKLSHMRLSQQMTNLEPDRNIAEDQHQRVNKETSAPYTNEDEVSPNSETIRSILRIDSATLSDIWYLVADKDVFIYNIDIIHTIINADNICSLMIPKIVMEEIERDASQLENSEPHRAVLYIYNALESEKAIIDEKFNSNSGWNPLIDCCAKLVRENAQVVLITSSNKLQECSKMFSFPLITVEDFKFSLLQYKSRSSDCNIDLNTTGVQTEDITCKVETAVQTDYALDVEMDETTFIQQSYTFNESSTFGEIEIVSPNSNLRTPLKNPQSFTSNTDMIPTYDHEHFSTTDIQITSEEIENVPANTGERPRLRKRSRSVTNKSFKPSNLSSNEMKLRRTRSVINKSHASESSLISKDEQEDPSNAVIQTAEVENISANATANLERRRLRGSTHNKQYFPNTTTQNSTEELKNKSPNQKKRRLKRSRSVASKSHTSESVKMFPKNYKASYSDAVIQETVNISGNMERYIRRRKSRRVKKKSTTIKSGISPKEVQKIPSNMDIQTTTEQIKNISTMPKQNAFRKRCRSLTNKSHTSESSDKREIDEQESIFQRTSSDFMKSFGKSKTVSWDPIEMKSNVKLRNINTKDDKLTITVHCKPTHEISDDTNVMFEITSQAMEDYLKMNIDEWISRFVQIMEEALTQILQQEPSFILSTLPPPWTIIEAVGCVKRKFHTDSDITDAANKLYNVLFEAGGIRGKITNDISPKTFMKMYSYGVYLIDTLQVLFNNNEDLQTAEKSLAKLIKDIQEPDLDDYNNDSFLYLDLCEANPIIDDSVKETSTVPQYSVQGVHKLNPKQLMTSSNSLFSSSPIPTKSTTDVCDKRSTESSRTRVEKSDSKQLMTSPLAAVSSPPLPITPSIDTSDMSDKSKSTKSPKTPVHKLKPKQLMKSSHNIFSSSPFPIKPSRATTDICDKRKTTESPRTPLEKSDLDQLISSPLSAVSSPRLPITPSGETTDASDKCKNLESPKTRINKSNPKQPITSPLDSVSSPPVPISTSRDTTDTSIKIKTTNSPVKLVRKLNLIQPMTAALAAVSSPPHPVNSARDTTDPSGKSKTTESPKNLVDNSNTKQLMSSSPDVVSLPTIPITASKATPDKSDKKSPKSTARNNSSNRKYNLRSSWRQLFPEEQKTEPGVKILKCYNPKSKFLDNLQLQCKTRSKSASNDFNENKAALGTRDDESQEVHNDTFETSRNNDNTDYDDHIENNSVYEKAEANAVTIAKDVKEIFEFIIRFCKESEAELREGVARAKKERIKVIAQEMGEHLYNTCLKLLRIIPRRANGGDENKLPDSIKTACIENGLEKLQYYRDFINECLVVRKDIQNCLSHLIEATEE